MQRNLSLQTLPEDVVCRLRSVYIEVVVLIPPPYTSIVDKVGRGGDRDDLLRLPGTLLCYGVSVVGGNDDATVTWCVTLFPWIVDKWRWMSR